MIADVLGYVIFDVILVGLFGWQSKRERLYALINLSAVIVGMICLHMEYYLSAGLFGVIFLVSSFVKLTYRATEQKP